MHVPVERNPTAKPVDTDVRRGSDGPDHHRGATHHLAVQLIGVMEIFGAPRALSEGRNVAARRLGRKQPESHHIHVRATSDGHVDPTMVGPPTAMMAISGTTHLTICVRVTRVAMMRPVHSQDGGDAQEQQNAPYWLHPIANQRWFDDTLEDQR